MNLTTPSTQELSDNIVSQLQAALSQSIPLLPKAFLRVIAKVIAGIWILLYKYAGFSLLQMFVPYASTQETTVNGRTLIPLVELGRRNGTGDPFAATRAILNVTVTVTNQVGTLPVGSQLVNTSLGVVYTSTGPVDLDAATVTVQVRAASDPAGNGGVGTIGNMQPGDAISFASPLPNVARTAVVASQVVTAADAETWDEYRVRVDERDKARPQGGAYADYRAWAREVPGIVAVYPYTGDPNEVNVYIEASVESSEDPDGIPTEAQIAAVEAAINLDENEQATRRPATAAVNVLPITRREFSVTIAGLSGPDGLLEELQDAIEAYYLDREPFIVGLSVLPRKDRVLLSTVISIIDEIVNAAGGAFGEVLQYEDGELQAFATLTNGQKAKGGLTEA